MKQILQYILDTVDVGLVLEQDEKLVIDYVDSYYIGDLGKHQSTTNYVFTFSEEPIN